MPWDDGRDGFPFMLSQEYIKIDGNNYEKVYNLFNAWSSSRAIVTLHSIALVHMHHNAINVAALDIWKSILFSHLLAIF